MTDPAATRVYNHIVSLGGNCRVAHNCRRHFGAKAAYPFDWWITPLESAIFFLQEPDVGRLYQRERLKIHGAEGRRDSIVSGDYGIRLHHEFPRVGGEVVETFRDLCAEPASRTAYLVERLEKLRSEPGRILFVRNAIHGEGRNAEGWHRHVDEILSFLDGAYGRRFNLLLINTPVRSFPDDRVLVSLFEDRGADWRGDETAWSRAFDAAGICYNPIQS